MGHDDGQVWKIRGHVVQINRLAVATVKWLGLRAGMNHHRQTQIQRLVIHGVDHRVVGKETGGGVYL